MAILTIKHYVELANAFINNVKTTNDAYYMFVARPESWVNANGISDDSANSVLFNAAVDTINNDELSVYNEILYGKLIGVNDVQNLIPRYTWTNNTPYARYDQNNANLYNVSSNSNQFYVVNQSYQVFKIINNNNGGNSTVQPSLNTTTGTFSTGDGYVWKYMYSIDVNSNTKFTTPNYIPVVANSQVSGNAIPGTIDSSIIYNGGAGYNVYEDGYLQNFIGAYSVQLPNTSSMLNDYYTNSSIYLKSGFGSGQLRNISGYTGATRTVTVNSPFNFFTHLEFTTSPSGTVAIGYTATQPIDYVTYVYPQGYFNVGDNVIQSNTNTMGTVLSVNNSVIEITRTTNTYFNTVNPIKNTNQDGTLETGTVSTTPGSLYANVVGGSFVANSVYSVGQYFRVGTNANNNIQRITAVNTSVITADIPFSVYNASASHYMVPNVIEPSSISVTDISGTVSDININSVNISISNVSITGTTFTVGESVLMINGSDVYQGANGVVAFSNSSAVILSSVNGTWTTGLFIQGQSSQLIANVGIVTNNPNITISSPTSVNGKGFTSGQKVYFQLNGVNTGNAVISTTSTIPNSLTEYTIGPAVTVTGDGSNALAYAVVNTAPGTSNAISQVVFINPGTGYTQATVSITANGQYGSGANVYPLISPLNGHGSDVVTELGGRYVGVTSTFGNLSTESYAFPYYGKFRTAGILANPAFDDVTVNLTSFDRTKLSISGIYNTFIPGEIIINTANATSNIYSNASGICVYSNSSYLEMKNVRGIWSNTSNVLNKAYGISSNAYASISYANVVYFTVGGNTEVVSEVTSGAQGIVNQLLSNTSIKLTNVVGQFVANDVIFDSSANAYANISSIYTSNGTVNATANFGKTFSELLRFTLTSNTLPFQQYEFINQPVSGANGRIVSTNSDIDLVISITAGTFSIGQTITDVTTSNTGIVLYANNTSGYLKLTNVSNNQAFAATNLINNGLGSTATITTVYPVLVLNNINGTNKFQTGSTIQGQTSGAQGNCSNSSSITYPSLVRETGSVLYLENFAPVTKTANSSEQINLVIKF